jgi:hypothetical protein
MRGHRSLSRLRPASRRSSIITVALLSRSGTSRESAVGLRWPDQPVHGLVIEVLEAANDAVTEIGGSATTAVRFPRPQERPASSQASPRCNREPKR